MTAPIGHKLAKVVRLANDLSAGPVHLAFDDGRGLQRRNGRRKTFPVMN